MSTFKTFGRILNTPTSTPSKGLDPLSTMEYVSETPVKQKNNWLQKLRRRKLRINSSNLNKKEKQFHLRVKLKNDLYGAELGRIWKKYEDNKRDQERIMKKKAAAAVNDLILSSPTPLIRSDGSEEDESASKLKHYKQAGTYIGRKYVLIDPTTQNRRVRILGSRFKTGRNRKKTQKNIMRNLKPEVLEKLMRSQAKNYTPEHFDKNDNIESKRDNLKKIVQEAIPSLAQTLHDIFYVVFKSKKLHLSFNEADSKSLAKMSSILNDSQAKVLFKDYLLVEKQLNASKDLDRIHFCSELDVLKQKCFSESSRSYQVEQTTDLFDLYYVYLDSASEQFIEFFDEDDKEYLDEREFSQLIRMKEFGILFECLDAMRSRIITHLEERPREEFFEYFYQRTREILKEFKRSNSTAKQVTLHEKTKQRRGPEHDPVEFLDTFIAYFEANEKDRLRNEGVFRIPGSDDKVKTLVTYYSVDQFKCSSQAAKIRARRLLESLDRNKLIEVHDVCSAFKKLIRMTKFRTYIIPEKMQDMCNVFIGLKWHRKNMDTEQAMEDAVVTFESVFKDQCAVEYQRFLKLMGLLLSIKSLEESNKMNANAIATCFVMSMFELDVDLMSPDSSRLLAAEARRVTPRLEFLRHLIQYYASKWTEAGWRNEAQNASNLEEIESIRKLYDRNPIVSPDELVVESEDASEVNAKTSIVETPIPIEKKEKVDEDKKMDQVLDQMKGELDAVEASQEKDETASKDVQDEPGQVSSSGSIKGDELSNVLNDMQKVVDEQETNEDKKNAEMNEGGGNLEKTMDDMKKVLDDVEKHENVTPQQEAITPEGVPARKAFDPKSRRTVQLQNLGKMKDYTISKSKFSHFGAPGSIFEKVQQSFRSESKPKELETAGSEIDEPVNLEDTKIFEDDNLTPPPRSDFHRLSRGSAELFV